MALAVVRVAQVQGALGHAVKAEQQAVGALVVLPEFISDLDEPIRPQKLTKGRCWFIDIGSRQVMIARNSKQNSVPRAKGLQFLPEPRQYFSLHLSELLFKAGLNEISGKENRIPRPAVVMDFSQILEKFLSNVGPERPLTRLAVVQVGEMKPVEVVLRSHVPASIIADHP